MTKPKTVTVVLNGRYKGHLPLEELKLPEAEANLLISGKIAKLKPARKKADVEEEPEA